MHKKPTYLPLQKQASQEIARSCNKMSGNSLAQLAYIETIQKTELATSITSYFDL